MESELADSETVYGGVFHREMRNCSLISWKGNVGS